MILQAAIFYQGTIYTLAKPARHHTILHRFDEVELKYGVQGFLNDDGRFVNRIEAADIAIREGQIDKLKFQPDTLFSEDLW